jgi:transcriptional regulator with XRE-family HTH domain
MTFGQAVRAARLARGLSQSQVARAGCLPQTYVSSVERRDGVPRLSNVVKLARGLGLPPSELFAWLDGVDAPVDVDRRGP